MRSHLHMMFIMRYELDRPLECRSVLRQVLQANESPEPHPLTEDTP